MSHYRQQEHKSDYKGQEKRAVKSLDASDIAGLEQGRGMGLAKAAELNGYPGPMHVLELSKELGLARKQADETMAIKAAMRQEAKDLGRRIVAKETELDRAFTAGIVDARTVDTLTAEIGALQGKLRACHLRAHVKMMTVLTAEQVRQYSKLRGYS
jgi:Spy/CpxP family protein refolding chaperone